MKKNDIAICLKGNTLYSVLFTTEVLFFVFIWQYILWQTMEIPE